MRKGARAVQTLATICAAALLLAACGSSNGDSSSSQSMTTSAEAPENVGANPTAKSREKSATAKHAGHDQKAKRPKKEADKPDPAPKKKPHATAPSGSGPRTESQEPVHVKGCVTGMTKSQCKAVGKAYEQQQASPPNVVKEGECPAGLSKQECRQAGEAIEEGQEGHVVKSSECPQAMTAEQCAEAGKAYEEVAK